MIDIVVVLGSSGHPISIIDESKVINLRNGNIVPFISDWFANLIFTQ
jgi:hypothetical protein